MVPKLFAHVFVFSLIAVAASAQEGFVRWVDPSGQLTFFHPTGWQASTLPSQNDGAVRAFTGSGAFECQVWLLPRAQTASWPEDRVRQHYGRAFAAPTWISVFAPLRILEGQIHVADVTVDDRRSWPTQRATLRGANGEARASLQGRPGLELISLCQSFDGVDRNAVFDVIAASVDQSQP